jgi:hypothetical protein
LTETSAARGGPEYGSAVWHPVFLDVVAVGLEQHVGAAMLADRLGGPLDHAVAFRLAAITSVAVTLKRFLRLTGLQLTFVSIAAGKSAQRRSLKCLERALWIEMKSPPRQPDSWGG